MASMYEKLHGLTDSFCEDIEAILKRYKLDPRKAGDYLISQVNSALAERLGEDATEKLFAKYGPKPKKL
jgi:hypothetical protein